VAISPSWSFSDSTELCFRAILDSCSYLGRWMCCDLGIFRLCKDTVVASGSHYIAIRLPPADCIRIVDLTKRLPHCSYFVPTNECDDILPTDWCISLPCWKIGAGSLLDTLSSKLNYSPKRYVASSQGARLRGGTATELGKQPHF
jgi:hypothetical protein